MSLYTSVLHEYKVLFHILLQRNLLDMNHVFAFCPSLSTIFLRDCSIMDSCQSFPLNDIGKTREYLTEESSWLAALAVSNPRNASLSLQSPPNQEPAVLFHLLAKWICPRFPHLDLVQPNGDQLVGFSIDCLSRSRKNRFRMNTFRVAKYLVVSAVLNYFRDHVRQPTEYVATYFLRSMRWL